MAKITGNLVATGLKFGIVTARFNDFINDKLLIWNEAYRAND